MDLDQGCEIAAVSTVSTAQRVVGRVSFQISIDIISIYVLGAINICRSDS